METVLMHGSLDQSIRPYNSQIRNPRKMIQLPWPFLSQSLQPQPPLLPLPDGAPIRRASSRGFSPSSSPPSKKPSYGSRINPSLPSSRSPKKAEKTKASENAAVPSSGPKAVPLNPSSCVYNKGLEAPHQIDMFSGSVAFTFSPPPSSLPLPTFSLRPKLSCNAEAAEIDAGATDDLRRLLRLR